MSKRKRTGARPLGTRTRRTEERILDSARHLLVRGGAADLTMRAVAQGADITIGAIYRHFPSREALLDRLVHDAFAIIELRLLRAVAPMPPGSLNRMIALGQEYIRTAQDHPEEFKILFSPDRRRPVPIERLPGMAGYGIVRQCVVEAMDSGVFRQADPDLVTFFLWSRVHGIIMLLAACDFSSVIMPDGLPITAQIAFDLTREFMTHGLSPSEDGHPIAAPERREPAAEPRAQ